MIEQILKKDNQFWTERLLNPRIYLIHSDYVTYIQGFDDPNLKWQG